uniref:Transient receptor potential channel-1 n=1 Tax=Hofstenia miamia TaxID=442651 RepID=A0A068CJS8_HOFMI|nr:transient receptor potential channel-1 [Hofstenia miamia]
MPPYYNTEGDDDRIHLKVVRGETETSAAERQYLQAVEKGDFSTVHNLLEESSIYFNININCVDALGRTALHIAIENENMEIIELLLSYNIELSDTLLYAIEEEVVQAVEMLLNYKQPKVNKKDKFSMQMMKKSESNFTPDITPVVLAAHKNNYEILKMLISRGATIIKPHNVKCGCYECVHSATFDSLRHSQTRMNAYRALASPSLMILSSDDPILTAFELSWELYHLSFSEVEFKEEYIKLSDQCQKFAVDLLDQTRGSLELKTLLNRTTDTAEILEIDEKSQSLDSEYMNLSRFKLSIEYRQQAFVSHPNCQQLLSHIWYAGIPGWRQGSFLYKLAFTLLISITFPFTSIFYLFFPFTKPAKVLKNPFVKFINHSASYFVFLVLLVLASADNITSEEGPTRNRAPNIIEWAIISYVMAFVWSEAKEIWESGFVSYTRDLWNIMDFIQNSLYITTITLRAIVYFGPDIKVSRAEMSADDPMLVAEGLFAVANIASTMRLLFLFTANSHLGPLQISLGRMMIDIIKFLFVFTLVLLSFASGMNQLLYLEYDEDDKNPDCEGVVCDEQNYQFRTIIHAIITLFWTVMGIVDLSAVSVNNSHSFTKQVAMLMYATYHIIAIVVLLNMLIAMLNLSYEQIIHRADIEWKFARSKMWMSYFEDGGTLPPPFNLVPSPKSTWKVIMAIRTLCIPDLKELEKRQTLSKLATRMKENDRKYQDMLTNLTQRYIAHMKKTLDIEPVTEDDLNEIKQDISAFRYEVIELLRKEDGDDDKSNGRTRKNTGSRPTRRNRTLKSNKTPSTKNEPKFISNYMNEKENKEVNVESNIVQNMSGNINNTNTVNMINNTMFCMPNATPNSSLFCSLMPVFIKNSENFQQPVFLTQDANDPTIFYATSVQKDEKPAKNVSFTEENIDKSKSTTNIEEIRNSESSQTKESTGENSDFSSEKNSPSQPVEIRESNKNESDVHHESNEVNSSPSDSVTENEKTPALNHIDTNLSHSPPVEISKIEDKFSETQNLNENNTNMKSVAAPENVQLDCNVNVESPESNANQTSKVDNNDEPTQPVRKHKLTFKTPPARFSPISITSKYKEMK